MLLPGTAVAVTWRGGRGGVASDVCSEEKEGKTTSEKKKAKSEGVLQLEDGKYLKWTANRECEVSLAP